MPMIDVWIPEGALEREAEAQLMRELTDIHLGYIIAGHAH
jgi:phenylpyruvate tautomerase PptA (4-oxalocrotonate tautomerase family)